MLKWLPGLVFLAFVAPVVGWQVLAVPVAMGLAVAVLWDWPMSRLDPRPVDPDALRDDPIF